VAESSEDKTLRQISAKAKREDVSILSFTISLIKIGSRRIRNSASLHCSCGFGLLVADPALQLRQKYAGILLPICRSFCRLGTEKARYGNRTQRSFSDIHFSLVENRKLKHLQIHLQIGKEEGLK